MERAVELDQVSLLDAAHEGEHSLEVHLPFLQIALGDFSLVPLVVGEASPEEVAEVLKLLWGGDETLIVVSSDLSHYLPYDKAQELDEVTARAIQELRPEALGRDQACGRMPVAGLLLRAREEGLSAECVDLRNSGDTAGSRNQVVGYGSFVFA
jgi:AmmeMemoRadiSam system protein B